MAETPAATEVVRAANGRWLPGTSPNPTGFSGEQQDKLRKVRLYAAERTYEAMDKVLDIMRTSDDPKVALAAATVVLKTAGCFDSNLASDDAVVARIQAMIAEERAKRGL